MMKHTFFVWVGAHRQDGADELAVAPAEEAIVCRQEWYDPHVLQRRQVLSIQPSRGPTDVTPFVEREVCEFMDLFLGLAHLLGDWQWYGSPGARAMLI